MLAWLLDCLIAWLLAWFSVTLLIDHLEGTWERKNFTTYVVLDRDSGKNRTCGLTRHFLSLGTRSYCFLSFQFLSQLLLVSWTWNLVSVLYGGLVCLDIFYIFFLVIFFLVGREADFSQTNLSKRKFWENQACLVTLLRPEGSLKFSQ